ncbi:hypothetical protein [Fodinibius sediminis]|uniref:Uncharacterized protein n=1 Tax=Fodinibius sediminis TaxID=1214077 RepID=A0A521AR23_9BACT|nr:hypothetical protein [Fodinibius sediminis]SMO37235.1 hypothetical protein SAMN06265218_101296 [Fodinibius sediminis]
MNNYPFVNDEVDELSSESLRKVNGGVVLVSTKVIEIGVAFVSGFVGCWAQEEIKEAAAE